jgi:hypothetical protein
VAQPAFDPTKPHLAYPPGVYEHLIAMTDGQMWSAVPSQPPVKAG